MSYKNLPSPKEFFLFTIVPMLRLCLWYNEYFKQNDFKSMNRSKDRRRKGETALKKMIEKKGFKNETRTFNLISNIHKLFGDFDKCRHQKCSENDIANLTQHLSNIYKQLNSGALTEEESKTAIRNLITMEGPFSSPLSRGSINAKVPNKISVLFITTKGIREAGGQKAAAYENVAEYLDGKRVRTIAKNCKNAKGNSLAYYCYKKNLYEIWEDVFVHFYGLSHEEIRPFIELLRRP